MEEFQRGVDRVFDLICRFRAGDEAAFDELLAQYQPLIESLVTRFSSEARMEMPREDLRQEAAVAFYRSVTSYDLLQRDVEFGLYAKICISNALVSKLRAKKHPIEVEALSEVNGRGSDADASDEDPVARILEQERLGALYAVIRENLSDFEYRVWNLYLSGRTAKEIGALVGRDEKAIANAIYRIRRKLRAVLA
ncbi:MAG: sigma-70 family RNA polymerase sigma factor [Clostridia bacterium]|nr:sigma-70 family RNA polymerase sigma factor [Clostridia bacterium]